MKPKRVRPKMLLTVGVSKTSAWNGLEGQWIAPEVLHSGTARQICSSAATQMEL